MDICAQVFPFEILRQGWNSLQFLEHPCFGGITKSDQSRIQFINQVSILSVGVKREVTRTGTGLDIYFSMFMQHASIQVHAIDEKFIQAQIGCDCKVVGGVWQNTMCMRAGLSL